MEYCVLESVAPETMVLRYELKYMNEMGGSSEDFVKKKGRGYLIQSKTMY